LYGTCLHLDTEQAAHCTAKSTFLPTNRQLSVIVGQCFRLPLCSINHLTVTSETYES